MAEKDPSDVPAVPIPPLVDLTGNGDEAKPAAKPRKKAEPKAVPPAVPSAAAVPPVEAAPAAPAAPVAPAAPAAPANPYAAASTAAPAQPNPYATPQPYANGPYVPQPPKGLAITSMVLGIVGLVFCGTIWLVSVGAIVTGHIAQKNQPYARGMWITGLITGYIGAVIGLLWGLLWLIPIFMGFGTYGFSSF